MYQTFSLRFMVASSKRGKDGLAPLMLNVIVNSSRVCIQLKKRLKPNDFNNKTQLSKFDDVNHYMDIVRSRIMEIQTDLFAQRIALTAQKIKDCFNGIQVSKQWGLLELYQNHNQELRKMVGITITKNTCDKHDYVLNYLNAYMANKDKPIADVKASFITGFFNYLRHDIKQENNTAVGYMKKLKMIFKIAANDGYISKNPFDGIKYSLKKVTPTYLTDSEVLTIWQKQMGIKRMEQVRDVYIFNCLTGLAYIDCKNLTKDQIFKDDQGNVFIKRYRQKTKIQSTIPLNEIALSILEKYNYHLPVPSNQKMNSYLKEIGDVCGITKKLTTHTARHSAATMLLNHGVSLYTVSAVLGHSSVKMTQHYAKLLDKTIINEIKSIKLLQND